MMTAIYACTYPCSLSVLEWITVVAAAAIAIGVGVGGGGGGGGGGSFGRRDEDCCEMAGREVIPIDDR
jgi:hypothetical protein